MFGLSTEKWEELNGFNTASEIYQQPSLWLEVLEIIEEERANIERFIKKRLSKTGIRVIFTGAGTSGFIGEILSPELNKNDYIYEAIHTTDIVTNPETYFKRDIPTLLVSFARSGNSPESVAAYNLANKLVDDISHIFITCNKEGELAKIAQGKDNVLSILMPEKANDKALAMTSSFSAMTLAAFLIFDLDNLEKNIEEIKEMNLIGKEIMRADYESIKKISELDYDRTVYLGTGSFYGLSKESGLKLLELTRGQVIPYNDTPLGFRHGPKSLVNDNTLIYIYISDDEYVRKYELDLLKEVYHDAGDHTVVAISNRYYKEIEDISHKYIYLNKGEKRITNDVFISLLFALYAQTFALLSSIKTNVEPDNPNPQGLISRVVQGVIIYEYE